MSPRRRGTRRAERGQPTRHRNRFDPKGRVGEPGDRRFREAVRIGTLAGVNSKRKQQIPEATRTSPLARRSHRSGGTRAKTSFAGGGSGRRVPTRPGKTASIGREARVTTIGKSIVAET